MFRAKSQLAAVLIFMAACAFSANADGTSERCVEEADLTIGGWENWTAITSSPVKSQGHGNQWVKIYVNELARETYKNADAPYRECSKIVKPLFSSSDGKSIAKLTAMVKMAPGYDPANGDWWYALYDGPGTELKKQGKLYTDCIACHKQAAKTDYLFSEDVLEEAKE